MLQPDYFANKEDRIQQLFDDLETFALKDIGRRLIEAEKLTATADRQIYKLQQMNLTQKELLEKLEQITSMTDTELQILLQDAVLTSFLDDAEVLKSVGIELQNPLESPEVIAVIDAEYKKTKGELYNLTRTSMLQFGTDLGKMLDDADIKVATGMQSYDEAINDILDAYAKRGQVINYPSGTNRSLEAAVRCAVVTSMNQTAAQVSNEYIRQAECEYVLISAHLGARVATDPIGNHMLWQGKVFKIRGSAPGYPNLLESTGYDIDPATGQGSVVNPIGLHGYNCRHSHRPWDIRLKNPYEGENAIDNAESAERFKNLQTQRRMERAIRSRKRELVVKQLEIDMANPSKRMKLESEYLSLTKKLEAQNKAYNDFSEAHGLATQYARTMVADFNLQQHTETIKGMLS